MRLPVSMIKGVDLFNSVLLDGLGDFRTVHIDTVWQGQDYRRKLCWVAIRSEEQPVEMKCVKCREQRRRDQLRSIANRLSYLVCLDKVLFGKSQFDCVGRAAK
jgi:hypothetical protein